LDTFTEAIVPTKAPPPASGSKPKPLTEDELTYLRDLIEKDKRVKWLWTTARTWALWITGVGAALVVGKDGLRAFIGYFASGA
jgi:hypothetical protein